MSEEGEGNGNGGEGEYGKKGKGDKEMEERKGMLQKLAQSPACGKDKQNSHLVCRLVAGN